MENSNVKTTGTIKFDVLEDGNLKISIECSEFKYFELLGILEHLKSELINDNKNNL
jgi:hypothetical protein